MYGCRRCIYRSCNKDELHRRYCLVRILIMEMLEYAENIKR